MANTGAVECVPFIPDGAWVASASLDGTVKIWKTTPLPESTGVVEEKKLPCAQVRAMRRERHAAIPTARRALRGVPGLEGFRRSPPRFRHVQILWCLQVLLAPAPRCSDNDECEREPADPVLIL